MVVCLKRLNIRPACQVTQSRPISSALSCHPFGLKLRGEQPKEFCVVKYKAEVKHVQRRCPSSKPDGLGGQAKRKKAKQWSRVKSFPLQFTVVVNGSTVVQLPREKRGLGGFSFSSTRLAVYLAKNGKKINHLRLQGDERFFVNAR
jgi:hypothetical protein